MPAERVAVLGVLRLEILRAVLAHDLDARLDEHAMSSSGHVLRRRDDVTSGPTSAADALVARADLLRRQHDHPLAPASAPASRGARRRAPGGTRVQRSTRSTARRPRRAQRALGRRPEIELAARTTSASKRAGTRGDLLPHLVAARADRRADDRGLRGVRPRRAGAASDDAAEQAAPAGVQRRRAPAGRRPRARSRSAGSRRSGRASAGPARRSRARPRVRCSASASAIPVGVAATTRVPCCWRRSVAKPGSSRPARRDGAGSRSPGRGRRRCAS